MTWNARGCSSGILQQPGGADMHRVMMAIARIFALIGGTVLAALIVMICLSILGRELSAMLHGAWAQSAFPGVANWLLGLGIGPIEGDFEILEASIGFAIFAFLPICQITAGHATVDVFTSGLSARANAVLRMIGDILFAAVLILIAWRLGVGGASKFSNGETTLLLQFPVWWGYAASLVAAIAAALVAVYVAVVRVQEVRTVHDILPSEGAEH